MEKDDIFHDCVTGILPDEGQCTARQERDPPFMLGEERPKVGSINCYQAGSEMAPKRATSLSHLADEEDYDSDCDSDIEEDLCINKFSDDELEKYTKQANLRSLLDNPRRADISPRASDGVCWDDERLRKQKGKSDLRKFNGKQLEVGQLTEVNLAEEEQKPKPDSLRVRVPTPYPENSAKSKSLHSEHYSPPLHPRRGRMPLAMEPRRSDKFHHDTSPAWSLSSSSLSVDQHTLVECPNPKALSKLTIDQQIAMADRQIDEARNILVVADSTKDERLNALTVMTDWNEVKANAEQRKMPSRTTDTVPHKQKGVTASIHSKEKRALRKRLSGFFKKTTAPHETSIPGKNAIAGIVPIVKANDELNEAEVSSCMNLVNITNINADLSLDEGTSTFTASGPESTSDHDNAMQADHNAPPMPPMPKRLAEAAAPKAKTNNRNFHLLGTPPAHKVIIDNTHAYFSPDKRHHRRPAKISEASFTDSGTEYHATTFHVPGKRSVVPIDADLNSEHSNHSANDHDDTTSTPIREHRPKTSSAARKRPEPCANAKEGEQMAEIDEHRIATRTQQSFDASAYSGDEHSVHTANPVPMTFHKAKMMDIPARRGNKHPAAINVDDPRNTALFSNPPDEDDLRVEIKAEAKKAQRAQATADETMAKRLENAPSKLKTKCTLSNLKNAFKFNEEKADQDKGKGIDDHMEGIENNREEEKGKHERGPEDESKEGESGDEGNGTARARMEGYKC